MASITFSALSSESGDGAKRSASLGVGPTVAMETCVPRGDIGYGEMMDLVKSSKDCQRSGVVVGDGTNTMPMSARKMSSGEEGNGRSIQAGKKYGCSGRKEKLTVKRVVETKTKWNAEKE